MTIPNWDEYLIIQAFVAAQRSPDLQTKCGCVIVNEKKQILSQGYNGFPRGVDDSTLPKTRPDKYDWMIHAEVNAILNTNANLDECVAYITTKPCFNCTLLMWQSGIREIVYSCNGHVPSMLETDKRYEGLMKRFLEISGMVVRKISIDGKFLNNVLDTLAGL